MFEINFAWAFKRVDFQEKKLKSGNNNTLAVPKLLFRKLCSNWLFRKIVVLGCEVERFSLALFSKVRSYLRSSSKTSDQNLFDIQENWLDLSSRYFKNKPMPRQQFNGDWAILVGGYVQLGDVQVGDMPFGGCASWGTLTCWNFWEQLISYF